MVVLSKQMQDALACAIARTTVIARAKPVLAHLVQTMVPGGRLIGEEYTVLNPTRNDRRLGSFSINVRTGNWIDRALGSDACGPDVIDFIQYCKGQSKKESLEAIRNVLNENSLSEIVQHLSSKGDWTPILPIPTEAGELTRDIALLFAPAGFEPTTAYRYDNGEGGALYYSVRYERPAGGPSARKECRPIVYATHNRDGFHDWRLMAPRGLKSLYNLPRLASMPTAPVIVTEGEPACERASMLFPGYAATTSPNGSNGARKADWSPLAGRNVSVWPDNDVAGAKYAKEVVERARAAGALTVRIVDLPPGLPDGWDLADDVPAGGAFRDLQAILNAATPIKDFEASEQKQLHFRGAQLDIGTCAAATPFVWADPKDLPPREVLYGSYQRRFLSALIAPPKTGKTALITAESIAMVTGRDLLGIKPFEPLRVWIVCEDPRDELQRRIAAAVMRYGVEPGQLSGGLFVDSFREKDLIVAEKTGSGIDIKRPLILALAQSIRDRGIDHLFIDPFVSTHRVPENDNGAIADAAHAWNEVADKANCSICLVHHTRKMIGNEVTVDDMRGGSSLLGVVRSVRTLNQMAISEVDKAGVETEQRPRYIKIGSGASNMFAPSDRSTWFFLESIDLGNRTFRRPSDEIGVATPWSWPAIESPNVTPSQLFAIQNGITNGKCKVSSQAVDWAGKTVAEVLSLDAGDARDKAVIKSMLKRWENDGIIKYGRIRENRRGRDVPVYEVAKWVIISSFPTS